MLIIPWNWPPLKGESFAKLYNRKCHSNKFVGFGYAIKVSLGFDSIFYFSLRSLYVAI